MNDRVLEPYVVDGMLLLFLDFENQSLRRDIINSNLYSQLAASKKYNKFTQAADWYGTYLKAMTTFGWLRLAVADGCDEVGDGKSIIPLDVIEKLLPKALQAWKGEKLRSLLASLLAAPLTEPTAKWRERCVLPAQARDVSCESQGAAAGSCVSIQIGFVLPTNEYFLLCLNYCTSEPIDMNPFAKPLNRRLLEGNFNCFAFTGRLDSFRYAPYRKRIEEATADKSDLLSAIPWSAGP